MKWYTNEVIMTFLGVILGAIIAFGGVVYSSQLQLENLNVQHDFDIKNRALDKKEEIYIDIVQSIYSLHKMNDRLIDIDLTSFKSESYSLSARVKIYGSSKVSELYEQFLTTFFSTQGVYDGDLVDNKLIPAIKEDLALN